eukprot:Protomagalhaensia_sp_Gyna_25__3268@NODE_296_length_4021_cov_107_137619_g221_i1_p1_GENE_NODE_296_length_4021_cov_107_137619_g221_i1NODE_296_length_4021_cov_107_137619_g221_i1_p1_ORF_typecomplete_len372_score66_48SMC_N/PF02463_19/0_0084Alpha2MRAP_C/PF06401_11/7_6e03Alpha2MRAP_C/PF06401_11/0_063Fzo_mitofusin/PF04799_13/0_84Fzo_mitofusin/PF04799_13/7_7e03Fzo_mitofusin/PF04799_13/4_7e02DUF2203/PF09969_9/10DUF2203/PF09969_9/1_4e03_NODE_296_length_4021_cov_107_137619_g221_i124553570
MAAFRKAEALNMHEEEFLSNLKNCMVCFLLTRTNKDAFCEAEGVILMARLLLAPAKQFHAHSLAILALAVTNHAGNCAQLFKQGLGGIFSYFDGAVAKLHLPLLPKRLKKLEQLTAIIKALAMEAQGGDQERLIAKFFENDAAKLRGVFAVFLGAFGNIRHLGSEEGWNLTHYIKALDQECTLAEPPQDEDLLDYDDRCDAGLIILQNATLILLSLCRYGNDIVSMQVHAYLNQSLEEDVKLLNIFANVILGELSSFCSLFASTERPAELCVFAPLPETMRTGILGALKDNLVQHESLCERVQALTAQAAVRAKELEALAEIKAEEERNEARRLRNRDRKQREKIKKYDRELERREQLEEYRYARKTGTLW